MDKNIDKRVIQAVAGSGKTSYIVEKLCLARRHLIITYTTENQNVIRNKVIEKFNCVPTNIHLFGYFEFIYSFCYKPLHTREHKGINFNIHDDINKYRDYCSNKLIYSNKIVKVLKNEEINYLGRINKYFDMVYVDEIQDFGSYDFDWLQSLANLDCGVLLVGDYYQHTFNTSTAGNKNNKIYTLGLNTYLNKFNGFNLDTNTLSNSYRCSESVCEFLNKYFDVDIRSHSNASTDIVFTEEDDDIDKIMSDDNIIKLFYQKHYEYNCKSNNWSASKGAEYPDVCVVLNKTTFKNFKDTNTFKMLAPTTKDKLYVACTRTKGNLYFIEQEKLNKYKLS